MINRALESLKHLSNLCRKEFLSLLKDPVVRLILIVPALIQSLLFGYSATYDLTHIPYALLDQSHSKASRELIAKLDATGAFYRVATLETPSQIREVIDSGLALMVLHLSPDFQQKLSSAQEAGLQLILDGRNSTTAASAAAHLQSLVSGFNREQNSRAALPVTIDRRVWYNPNLETRWSILPGLIASLSMMQTIVLAALSVAREREQGTFDQLLVTPYTPFKIMLGKAIPPIIIGLFQSTLILLVARYWFGIPIAGNLATLYCGLLCFNIAVVGVGLSISALSSTMQQAMLYSFILLVPMTLLSGLSVPVRNMPELFQITTYANPLRFAIHLVRNVYLEGASWIEVWRDLIPFLCIAVITLPPAAWLFRNRLA